MAKIALVTGANRGLGLEVAKQLADTGMIVFLSARDKAKAEDTANGLRDLGLDVRPIQMDVSDTASVEVAAAKIKAEFGHLDVLVNNAAAYVDWMEKVSNADLAAVQRLFETNLFGTWRAIQAFLPLLRQSQSARIVNVSSGAGAHADLQFGLTTNGGMTASYGISKAALNGLTAKLAAELAGIGILVNSVCPGLTATAEGMEAMGARPIADGAKSIVWAALLPDDGPSGGFFRDGKALEW